MMVTSFFCYWLRKKQDKKSNGLYFLALTILPFLFTVNNMYVVIVTYPTLIITHLLYINFWTFRLIKGLKIALITTSMTICVIIGITSYPWIKKWTFSKEDVRVLLAEPKVTLNDNFQLIENHYSGHFNFSQSFTVSVSKKDFERVKSEITNSTNFLKKEKYNSNEPPTASQELLDTLIYENNYFYGIEYFSKELNSNNTAYHSLQLRKESQDSYWSDKGKYILHYLITNEN